jgi:transcription termination factor NusB
MSGQMKKRVEFLERKSRTRHEKRTTSLDERLLAAVLNTALRDYPKEREETFAHLSSGRLSDAKDVLERITTGEEDQRALTPRAVAGVLHLLMHGVLETRENIADQIREPLTKYTSSQVLREIIIILLYDLTSNYKVLRDYPASFGTVCLNGGHVFRVDEREEQSLQ